MGLYDQKYVDQSAYDASVDRSESQIVSFVKDTYKLFAASMMAAAVGAYLTMPYAYDVYQNKFGLFILEIALLLGVIFLKRKPGINLALLFGFTFMTGVTLTPLLQMAIAVDASLIGNAFGMTALVFAGMSLFAIKTPRDFTSYSKPLMIALIIVVVFSLVNAFILKNPMLTTLISAAVVMLFSILVVYDTQNIIKGNYEHPIDGAIALYLDFLNIFTALLQIMLSFAGNDD